MLNIVIPMAGRGSRFSEAGYAVPKPLLPINGIPMIARVIENLRPTCDHRFIFVALHSHLDEYTDLVPMLHRYCSDPVILGLKSVTSGAASSVLEARHYIDSDDPLMIANSDQLVDFQIDHYLDEMKRQSADGLIMTFHANDPKWSYCCLDSDGTVMQVVEKQVVSDVATVGIYNFAKGCDFVASATDMLANDLKVNGEFYVAPVYNIMISRGKRIVIHNIEEGAKRMWGLGTPDDYHAYLDAHGFLDYKK